MPAFALRPMLPADAPLLTELFCASIDELTRDDYDERQREAWAAMAEDEGAFARRIAGGLTLVATGEGAAVGFALLVGNRIDLLYVAPDRARKGVGSLLLDALVKLAGAREVAVLTVDASDTARDFFAARGFVPQSRNTMALGDQWLGTTTMTLTLVPPRRSS